MSYRDALVRFVDPRLLIAILIIGLFGWAYGENVQDETLKGALIAGFNIAIGFWLGSARSNEQATENTRRAFEAITATATGAAPKKEGE